MGDYEVKPDANATIGFWELAGFSQHKTLEGETAGQFLARINEPSKWLYGSELRDEMLLKNPISLPRFGHLARKALIHYAGDRYNPHAISEMNEIFVRQIIKDTILNKREGYIKGYDWGYLDVFFAHMIGTLLEINIPYDKARLEEGIKPEFRSPFQGLELLPPN